MNPDATGVAIVGCGLIGQKRADALLALSKERPISFVACADSVVSRAGSLAEKLGPHVRTAVLDTWQAAIQLPDVEIVVVSTTNDVLAEITMAAVRAGKHVLVEKPAARNACELEPVLEAAREASVHVRVGFNHRYHAALLKAKEIVDDGLAGELMFVRGRYGHGGRVGYEHEWRANPALSGGGELIDQGVHLIDLSRWFLGEFIQVSGFAHTYYWPMPVDDNAFMMLHTARASTAFLHVSCTEWKNLFSLEVYGRLAKLHIEGLGGSYGLEKLAYYRMLPQMGPPETTIWEFPGPDRSWQVELAEFLDDIMVGREPSANLEDAVAALKVVEQIYQASDLDHHP